MDIGGENELPDRLEGRRRHGADDRQRMLGDDRQQDHLDLERRQALEVLLVREDGAARLSIVAEVI